MKHREIQVTTPPGRSAGGANHQRQQLSPQSITMSSITSVSTSKPIPAPRSKPSNSLTAAPLITNNPLESDDDIVEIRFDDSSDLPERNKHKQAGVGECVKHSGALGSRKTHQLRATSGSGTSYDTDGEDMKAASIQRSMDELRKREEDENEITRDLERQLAEIRRLEERQRNILQNTLRQVVHSVNDRQSEEPPQSPTPLAAPLEIPMDSTIDCTSLLSPSFNRRTPIASPLLSHRPTLSSASPQSPRKLSTPRRHDMQTINENGGYTMADLAAMSPASSHRTLSSIASPNPSGRSLDYGYSGSHSLPPRADRVLSHIPESFSDKNFRLSASYTELALPSSNSDMGDRCGYFSDRETERRRPGDEVKHYADDARRALLEFEIDKRRQQVVENNQLRTELQRLIQSGSIPAAKYDRLRDMYRDHISRSREYLGLSSSSLSSISTGRNMRGGYDGYTTDSDFMSSTEQLAGNISQSSTVERFMQSHDNLYKHSLVNKSNYSTASSPSRRAQGHSHPHPTSTSTTTSTTSVPTAVSAENRLTSAMPLLDIRAAKASTSHPNSVCELVKIGKSSLLSISCHH